MNNPTDNLFERALTCLLIDDPLQKVEATYALQKEWQAGGLALIPLSNIEQVEIPGRPKKPVLVDPKEVPRRKINSLTGRLALVHAIAHIEFNAINLALDAIYRFQHMPVEYYTDWCRVAAEESLHFTLLTEYLTGHGMLYGEQNAHNGLWEMAVKTDADVMVRMALVPRVLEARGLDVTPTMIVKLQPTGDTALIAILQKIFDDEIDHVRIGTHWYNTLCKERGLEPQQTFIQLIKKYMEGAKFGPFETEARVKAGFTEDELQALLTHF
jgi:uncharacterized ferritin-like protein (DUF455 family)